MDDIPYGSFGFKVEISADDKLALFQEVSGLSVQIHTEDFTEGGANHTTRKVITGASYSNIILKRGLCNTSMYQWIEDFLYGNHIQRLSGDIKLLGDDGSVVQVFHFERGIPVKWTGPSLNSMSSAIATEELEIAHEGLRVSNGVNE